MRDVEGYVIVCMGFAIDRPCSVYGQYLKAYNNRTGASEWTSELGDAMSFPSLAMATTKYLEPLVHENNHPVIKNFRVERPLTAFSVSIQPYTDGDVKEYANGESVADRG